MNNSTNYNSSYLTNVESVLSKLDNCFSLKGSATSQALSVGLFDEAGINSVKNAILSAFKNRNIDKDIKNINKSLEKFDGISINKLLKSNKLDQEQQKELLKSIVNNTDKNKSRGIGSFIENLGKISPKLAQYGEVFAKMISSGFNSHIKWAERYRDIYTSGVFLSEKLENVGQNASKLGIEIDDYTKVIQQNSELVSHLDGVYGEGEKVFADVVGQIKDVGNSLLWFKDINIKIASSFMKNHMQFYDNTTEGLRKLTSETEAYMKNIEVLSKMTGKNAELIAKENEKRENDLKYQMLIENNHQNRIAAMRLKTIMPGLTDEEIMGYILGYQNESLSLKYSLDKNFRNIMLNNNFRRNLFEEDIKTFIENIGIIQENYKDSIYNSLNDMNKIGGPIYYGPNDYTGAIGQNWTSLNAFYQLNLNKLYEKLMEESTDKNAAKKSIETTEDFKILKNIIEENLFKATGGSEATYVALDALNKSLNLFIESFSDSNKSFIETLENFITEIPSTLSDIMGSFFKGLTTKEAILLSGTALFISSDALFSSLNNSNNNNNNIDVATSAAVGSGTGSLLSKRFPAWALPLIIAAIGAKGVYEGNKQVSQEMSLPENQNMSLNGLYGKAMVDMFKEDWKNDPWYKFAFWDLPIDTIKTGFLGFSAAYADTTETILDWFDSDTEPKKVVPLPVEKKSDSTAKDMKSQPIEIPGYESQGEVIYNKELLEQVRKIVVNTDNTNSKMDFIIENGKNANINTQLNEMDKAQSRAES